MREFATASSRFIASRFLAFAFYGDLGNNIRSESGGVTGRMQIGIRRLRSVDAKLPLP